MNKIYCTIQQATTGTKEYFLDNLPNFLFRSIVMCAFISSILGISIYFNSCTNEKPQPPPTKIETTTP